MREAIDIAFDGFIHNKAMRGETEKRIDHRLLIDNTILAIETDEFAHQYYGETNEKERYDEFLTKTSYKFIFIRFNCDANRESGNAKTDLKHKLPVLLHTITTQMSRIRHGQNIQRLEILKLFCCTSCAKYGRELCTCPYTTFMGLPHLYGSTPPLWIYPTSMDLPHLYGSTPPLWIYPISMSLKTPL